jgi:hypothetical protein
VEQIYKISFNCHYSHKVFSMINYPEVSPPDSIFEIIKYFTDKDHFSCEIYFQNQAARCEIKRSDLSKLMLQLVRVTGTRRRG